MAKQSRQHKLQTDYNQIELEIRYLNRKYRKAHEWMPLIAAEDPEKKPEEVLKKILDRLTELKNTRIKLRKSLLEQRIQKAHQKPDLRQSQVIRPLSIGKLPNINGLASPEYIWGPPADNYLDARVHRLQQLGLPAGLHPKIDGWARASDFRHYVFDNPSGPDVHEKHLFFPAGNWSSDVTDFTNATGLQFLCEMEVSASILVDARKLTYFSGLLQYILPEAPWDGIAQWSLDQRFDIPIITCDADDAYFQLNSIAWQSPSGEDFPDDDHEVFSDVHMGSGLWINQNEYSMGPIDWLDRFESSFPVVRGQRPHIYIGFNIWLTLQDGAFSLGDPNFAWHHLGSGLRYEYNRTWG